MSTAAAEPAIRCDHALAIAHADAVTAYRPPFGRYRIEVWLDEAGWHVEYHIRQTPTSRFLTGGGPHYVIDAETGAIVSKKYYQ